MQDIIVQQESGGGTAPVIAELRRLETLIWKVSDDVSAAILDPDSSDMDQMRTAVRALINELEVLYRKL